MAYTDPYIVVHRRVRARCLEQLPVVPPSGCDREARRREYRARGEHLMRRHTRALGLRHLHRAYDQLTEDRRLAFLHETGRAAATYAEFAGAIEQAQFGCETERVRDIAALIAIFSILFDGLADEIPEVFAQETWDTLPLPSRTTNPGDLADKPPLVALTYRAARQLTTLLTESPGWSNSPDVKHRLSQAIDEAFTAERRSLEYQSFNSDCQDTSFLKRTMREKSIHAVRLLALIPLCVHGPVSDTGAGAVAHGMEALGTLVGWLDDMQDLLEDLNAHRWSDPLLTIYTMDPHFQELPPDNLAHALKAALAYDSVVDRLSTSGEHLFDHWADQKDEVDPSGRLHRLICDIASWCLSPTK